MPPLRVRRSARSAATPAPTASPTFLAPTTTTTPVSRSAARAPRSRVAREPSPVSGPRGRKRLRVAPATTSSVVANTPSAPADATLALVHQLSAQVSQLTGALTTVSSDLAALRQQVASPTSPQTRQTETLDTEPANHATSVASAVAMSMTGEATVDEPTVTSLGANLLGDIVDNKIKTKIWSLQYIDMYDLLKASPHQECSLQFDRVGGTTLKVVPAKRDPLSIHQWREAFDTYISIMGSNPSKSYLMPPLLRYKRSIENLQYRYRGGAWLIYDESFRRGIALPGSSLDWGVTDWDRYMDALHRDNSFSNLQSFRSPPNQSKVQPSRAQHPRQIPYLPQGKLFNAPAAGASSNIYATTAKATISPLPAANQSPLPSPVRPHKLAVYLKPYDPQLTHYLVDGFIYGFHINCSIPPNSSVPSNHPSAYTPP